MNDNKKNKKGEGIWGYGHFFHISLYSDMPTVQCYLIALPASLLHRQSLIAAESKCTFWTLSQKSNMQHTKKFIEVSRLCCVYGSVAEKRANTFFFGELSFRFHLCSIGRLKIKFFCTSIWRVIAVDNFFSDDVKNALLWLWCEVA